MIPKTIHYCWFGRGPLPRLAFECIESWRKFLPDHEIKLWNEDNFDINICHYTSQAYKAGKYAFVSDYARFWILYNHGGIYFDTDVKLLAPINDILQLGIYVTWKAMNDSAVFNPDAWRLLFNRITGRQLTRRIDFKEVIINDIDLSEALRLVKELADEAEGFSLRYGRSSLKGSRFLSGLNI